MTLNTSLARGVIAGAAALACAGTVFAQDDIKAYNPNDYILLNGSAIKPDTKWPTDRIGSGGGIKLGTPLTPHWDLQYGGNWAQSAAHGGARYHQWTAGVDALYLFTPGGFRPFLLAGAGVSHDQSFGTAAADLKRTSPYIDAGFGFQYKLTKRLGVQADIREVGSFYHDRIDSLGMKHSVNAVADVGFIWSFGDPTPRPMAAKVTETTETTTTTTTPEPVVVVPPPAPAPVPPRKYTLSASELFAFNSAKLGPDQPKLDDVATTLNANPDIANITIVGYTDRIGSTGYNQKLSEARANSVKTYLTDKGVAASRLTAVGKGEADPVAECKDVKPRAALIKCLEPNRRVEIEPVTFTKPAQ